MDSLWSKTVFIKNFPQLKGNVKTDVLIIGGGIAGVLCAYFLEKENIPYILVEAKNIGNGITKNTTAKITAQHGLLYNKLLKNAGVEKAKQYLSANMKAINKFREICGGLCGFENKDAYIYTKNDKNAIENEIAALDKLGCKTEFFHTIELPFDIAGAVKMKNQAQFHPLLFLSHISENLNIYENTKITELSPRKAKYEHGEITADKIIIATHFPFLNKHGGYFLKLYQHRSHIIALENAPVLNGIYLEDKKRLSFRSYENIMIIGGGGHKTGKKSGNWQTLREFKIKAYPEAQEKYFWAAQDCMTLDGIPYIGKYNKKTESLYVATGFNKWGMTSSMVSAMLLTDMIQGKKNEYEDVFSPQRSMMKKRLMVNGFTAAGNIITPTKPRCPHMGCALKYNRAERSWDCPCHGSRFEKTGELINNPATDDIKIKK